MRKPRDFDAELKALGDKAKVLRDRKLVQLGELAVATGADALPVEMLAGALLAAAQSKDAATKEAWRKSGAAFFQRTARGTSNSADRDASGGAADNSDAQPPAADPRPS
ncbi:conjugal transfer protein TraD [Sphingomonas sp. TREG-RG-20F-R18-01]|uniref:conjugal transfer protein TraD n=1 Tax=Sphingomonas sp. TREG-RG-20F-R18-01 TaxID=2914982 RepID=UPI001F58E46F|nr:conjugal transfer protein TraD [Sphingomonas sp. TREG-RG-20F-R18-01]